MEGNETLFTDRRVVRREPPVPPGQSPFRIKGAGFLGHMAWVDSDYPGGRAAFLADLSPAMRAYFETVFVAVSWYDLLALASAGAICAQKLGLPYREFIAMRGRHQANIDIGGMYRLLLKLASPTMVAPRVPKLMSNYLDFGEIRIRTEAGDGARIDVLAVPVILVDWLAGVYQGFLDVVIPAAGGSAPQVLAKIVPTGSKDAFPLCTMEVEIKWV